MLYPDQEAYIYSESNILGKLIRVRKVVEEKSRMSLSMAVPEDADVTRI